MMIAYLPIVLSLLQSALAVPLVSVHSQVPQQHNQMISTTSSNQNGIDYGVLCLVPLQLLKLNLTSEEESAINNIKQLFDFDHLKAILQPLIASLPDPLKQEAIAWLKMIEPPPALKKALKLTDAERTTLDQAEATDNFTAVNEFMSAKMAQFTPAEKRQLGEYIAIQRNDCSGAFGGGNTGMGNGGGVVTTPSSENGYSDNDNVNRPGFKVIGGRPNPS